MPDTDKPFEGERCTVRVPMTRGSGTRVCNQLIETMAYKGTGTCGERHLKIKTNDYEGTPSANQYGKMKGV